MPDHIDILRAGERLVALPDKALWWPSRQALLIADAHLGKAAAFRSQGIPVPAGTTGLTLARLESLLTQLPVRELFVLGDFLHARASRTPAVLQALSDWRARWPDLHCVLVRGNHDSHAGDPPAELGVHAVDEPWAVGPFDLWHIPPRLEQVPPERYALAGHVHPAYVLQGGRRERLRLPCFDFGPAIGVLPAFGEFTGGFVVPARPGHTICLAADHQIFAVPPR